MAGSQTDYRELIGVADRAELYSTGVLVVIKHSIAQILAALYRVVRREGEGGCLFLVVDLQFIPRVAGVARLVDGYRIFPGKVHDMRAGLIQAPQ